MRELTSPLQDIIRRAAASEVQGPAARLKARMSNASSTVAILADLSGSMADPIGLGNMSKFDHLMVALRDVVANYPSVRIIGFGSRAKEMTIAELEQEWDRSTLGGSTDLEAALQMAARLRPRKTIIISDGLPDSQKRAEAEAAAMTGAVDTVYCGPDGHPAVQWLRSLAHGTGGTQFTWDGATRELGQVVRLALPAPSMEVK